VKDLDLLSRWLGYFAGLILFFLVVASCSQSFSEGLR
jgi:hypothetical protein